MKKTLYMTIESCKWPLQAVVFDKDGVLIDQTDLAYHIHLARRQVFQEAYGDASRRVLDQTMGVGPVVDLDGPSVMASLDHALVIMSSVIYQITKNPWFQCLQNAQDLMTEADNRVPVDSARLLPGARDLLRCMFHSGILLGLVTADHSRRTRSQLQALNINRFFDQVVTADDTVRQKPHPDPLLHVLDKWRCSPADVILIGDTANDWKMGHAVNVRTVAMCPRLVTHPGVVATIHNLSQVHITGQPPITDRTPHPQES